MKRWGRSMAKQDARCDLSANLAAAKRRLETLVFLLLVLQVFCSQGCLGSAFVGRLTGFYDAEI